MLDLFCGRFGWSKAFAARGWVCVGVDLIEPPEIPQRCTFIKQNILEMKSFAGFDFICASPPCEQFSKHGLRCFYPKPPYPELGLKLFNHTRRLCEESVTPYVIENVRAAQQFVGSAVNHCGPFYLWGNGVPPLMAQGILKGRQLRRGGYGGQFKTSNRNGASIVATIPPELANCTADYAIAITGRD